MALTDEQRAMLQLLLEGGQSYDDIGSLLGIAPDEVRTRARDALRDMAGADPDGQVGLSDYLLGQADPIGRADAIRHLQSDPEANATAERLVQQLKLLAPKAELPEIPAARGGRSAAPPPPPPAAATTTSAPSAPAPPPPPKEGGMASRVAGALSSRKLPSGKRRTQLFVGAGALVVLAIVAIIVLAGGGGSGGSDCKSLDTSAAQASGVPTIAMKAVGTAADSSCAPSGQVTLSAVQQQTTTQAQSGTFALQITAANLQPTSSGDTYLLWLYKSDSEAFPLGQQTVTGNGDLTGAVPLNAQQVLLLTAFDKIRLSRVTSQQVQQVQQSVQSQTKNSSGVVSFVGTPVLEGSVSELGLNQLLQQAQQQAGGASGGGTGAQPQGGGTGAQPQGGGGGKGGA